MLKSDHRQDALGSPLILSLNFLGPVYMSHQNTALRRWKKKLREVILVKDPIRLNHPHSVKARIQNKDKFGVKAIVDLPEYD